MTAARRPSGLIYAALALSVAVNLVGAGYLGYVSLHPRPPRTVESTIAFASARYPGAVGEAVRARLQQRRPELIRTLEALKESRRATRDAMSAEPLDIAKVDAAFADARAKLAQFQVVIHGAIIDALPDVDPADRAKVDRNGD